MLFRSSLSYRHYEDDWGVRSNTVDARNRIPYDNDSWLEPHVRFYEQTAADFFHQGFRDNAPRPTYASADQRLGRLRTITLGATYGFRVGDLPGEWYVRAEYMGQFGKAHPVDAIGVQRTYNQAPVMHVGSVVVGWTFER